MPRQKGTYLICLRQRTRIIHYGKPSEFEYSAASPTFGASATPMAPNARPKSKASAFAFTSSTNRQAELEHLRRSGWTTYKGTPSTWKPDIPFIIHASEVKDIISSQTRTKKSPDGDLTMELILNELPYKAVLRIAFLPAWRLPKIIMILKP